MHYLYGIVEVMCYHVCHTLPMVDTLLQILQVCMALALAKIHSCVVILLDTLHSAKLLLVACTTKDVVEADEHHLLH